MNGASMRILAALLLAFSGMCAPAFAGEKPLPPAFGKELVPDEMTNERNESKTGEIEDEKEDAEERAARHPVVRRAPSAGGKIHIQLDGDEDGGGDDDSDDGL